MMKMVPINLVDWVPGCGYEYGIHRVMIAKKSSMPLMSALPSPIITLNQLPTLQKKQAGRQAGRQADKARQAVDITALLFPDCVLVLNSLNPPH
jgi:hypothetical protein